MLAFVTPSAPLAPATVYRFSFVGVFDNSGKELPATEFTFTTEGEQPSVEDWSPGISDTGDWKTHREKSPWQDLPPLQAAAGVTAVSGQVLKLDGKPLANVTLSIDGTKTRSDGTGRFLLPGVSSGHHVLFIDGRAASNRARAYGVFEAGVDIAAGKTNVLTYVIWMTALDNAHAVTIPSPTTAPMVISSPLLPGVELHLPAGTKITDHEGRPVTRISITPIPVDRPPFPLPLGVHVPIYFTIQPGSAYIHTPYHKGARLIYPNFTRLVPRTPVDFWNYDPDEKGWYVYGKGKVSADAQQVIPDPSVAIYEFTGAMIQGIPIPIPSPPPYNQPTPPVGDPVDPGTGLFVYSKTDLYLPDVISIDITRTYRQSDPTTRAFGVGTNFPYEMFLTSTNNYHDADLVMPNGSSIHYICNNPIGCLNSTTEYTHTSSPTAFYGSRLVYTSQGFGWDLILRDGTVYRFGDLGPLQWIKDRYGNKLRICRASANNGAFCEAGYGDITRIISPNGRWVKFTYDTSHRITQVTDNIGRTVSYTYNPAGDLWKVTDANNGVTELTYNPNHQMLTIKDPRNITYLTNDYDVNGRVRLQTLIDGAQYQFSYTLDTNGNVIQTDSTDPRGYLRRTTFGPKGYTTSDTIAVGTQEQVSLSYTRNPDTGQLLSETNTLSASVTHTSTYTYYPTGKVHTVTRLSGTPNPATTTFAYESRFQQVASITDPMLHTSTLEYDAQGKLIRVKDPLQHETLTSYNGAGQLVGLTDPSGNTVSVEYEGADPVRVTDALGNVTTHRYDGAGRLIATTDPTGHSRQLQYDALNKILSITDSLGGKTSFTYDANGNLTTVQDPRQQGTNNKITFTYNTMDRLESRTDQLLRQDSFEYDLGGNLVKVTDRRGKISTFQYNGLNRRVFAGFGTIIGTPNTYESTISYQYDRAGRLTQLTDSQGGTITRQYDDVNRQTVETTPQGIVTTTSDAAGRRTGMLVAGQPLISYGYDNANRLTSITQGSSTVNFGFDNAGRRTSLAFGNGVSVDYAYDKASRPTGITYRFGTTVLGNLTYGYDGAGRKTQMGGTFARTALPNPLTSATYDAANQLTNWNGIVIPYDLNGNMLSDGSNTFAWNARNQLASLNGASPIYDALGRRMQDSTGKSFLFVGSDAVQELSGASVTANLLTGGTDEGLTRTDSSGSFTFLRDALGSTLAVVDSGGNVQTTYTYDPFGNTSSMGAVSSNASQFTGRENDGNGLYYYRARYYSPVLGRFISQDPIGLRGGINQYAYVLNNPLAYTDPFGLEAGSLNTLVPGPNGEVANVPDNAGRKEWARVVEVNSCAAELSQYGSLHNLSNGWIPELVGSNSAGDIAGFLTSPSLGEAGHIGTDAAIHAVVHAAPHIAVDTTYALGIPISYFPGVYNPITVSRIAITLGNTAIGGTVIGTVQFALKAKIVLDAGVYLGALVDCSLE